MNYKEILAFIYQAKNPEKLGEIDELLGKYIGSEKKLLEAIYEKYNLTGIEVEQLENGLNPFIKQEKKTTKVRETELPKQKKNILKPIVRVLGISVVLACLIFAGKYFLFDNSSNETQPTKLSIYSVKKAPTLISKTSLTNLSFEGTLGNAGTIVMNLHFDNKKVSGNYYYTKNGTEMSLEGTKDGNHIEVTEYNCYGEAIAAFDGILNDNDRYKGSWKTLSGNRSIDFNLKTIYNNLNDAGIRDPLNELVATYTGRYGSGNNKENGANLMVNITSIEGNRIMGNQNDNDYEDLPLSGCFEILNENCKGTNNACDAYRLLLFQPNEEADQGRYELTATIENGYVTLSGIWYSYNSGQMLQVNVSTD